MRIELSDFVNEICGQINVDEMITENLFVFIEQNDEYKIRYDNFCDRSNGDPWQVNKMLGRLVKENNSLRNTGRSKATRTSLIKTFTKH